MALNYVNLVFTEQDAGNTPSGGAVTIAPTATVVAAGQTVVSQQPVSRQLGSGTVTVSLVATDNAGTTPAAGFWAYSITLPGGQPQTYLLPFSGGATQQFSNLTPAVASTTYGPAAGSGGFANPMTTLGDIMYENATPAAARLAGSTSATKNFLTQTGNGSVSAAPAWSTIAAADLPAGTTSTQGALQLDGTAADIQPDGVQAAGAVGKAADSGHAHPRQPWQFMPESYGAKGDGKVIGDAVLSSSTTLTSASAGFTSAVNGMKIMINGALGTANIPLITTMTFVNATTVTLGSAASVSGTGFQAVYGSDDTAAINSAVTAAKNYALTAGAAPGSGGYFAEIVFGAKIYVLSSGPTQLGNGSTTPTFNTQIPIPYPAPGGTSQILVIALTGAGDAGYKQFWMSTVPNLAGTCLVSMLTHGNSVDPTFGHQSVIGGPTGPAGFTSSQGLAFANVKIAVKGISVWCSPYTNLMAYDFGALAQMSVRQSAAHVFAIPGYNGGTQPYLKDLTGQGAFTSSLGVGFRTPNNQDNIVSTMDNVVVQGYQKGYIIDDHFTAGQMVATYCDVALQVAPAGGLEHLVSIQGMHAEVYNGGLTTAGIGPQTCQVDISWSAECGSVIYDINDTGNYLRGVFHFADPADSSRGITVNGGANLKIISDQLGPGVWPSPPAAPASGAAQQNTAWRDATVYLSATTGITAVSVDSTALGLAAGNNVVIPVRVPSGHSYTPTYTGVLTAKWVLE